MGKSILLFSKATPYDLGFSFVLLGKCGRGLSSKYVMIALVLGAVIRLRELYLDRMMISLSTRVVPKARIRRSVLSNVFVIK